MQAQVLDKNKKGFSTLTSVILLMVATMFVIVSTISLSTDTFQSSSASLAAIEAKELANSCGEIGINNLKLDTNYAGNVTINLGNGSCTISTISGTGNTNRIFTTTGTVRNVVRKTEVSIGTVNPTTILNYWNELVI